MQVHHESGVISARIAALRNERPILANLTINLKQWRILHAVVACGSYANAASALGMSQPAVSYTIAKMEEQLGVILLRQEGRRAQLTEHGVTLLERAGVLLREAFDLEEYVADMRRGLGPLFRLAVDRHFPTRSLLGRLKNFSVQGRPVRIQLIEVGAPSVVDLLRECQADLAVVDHIPAGLSGEAFSRIEYVMVAHPNHPLARLNRKLKQADLDREVEVAVVPESNHTHGTLQYGFASQWRVSNFDTAETALLDGVGYGCMPRHRIEGLLSSGRLKELDLENACVRKSTYYLVFSRAQANCPDAHKLAQWLVRID